MNSCRSGLPRGGYSSLGGKAQEAFEKVRGFVVQVADWAAKGDPEALARQPAQYHLPQPHLPQPAGPAN